MTSSINLITIEHEFTNKYPFFLLDLLLFLLFLSLTYFLHWNTAIQKIAAVPPKHSLSKDNHSTIKMKCTL